MRSFWVPNRKQMLLLTQVSPDCIAPAGGALRCIDELVDQLGTTEIEKNYDLENEQGREPFHPKTVISSVHLARLSVQPSEDGR